MQQQVTFGRRGLAPTPQRPAPSFAPAPPPAWTAPAPAVAAEPSGEGVLARLPLATGAILLALVLVFGVEQAAALEPPMALSPGFRSLTALGGVNARLALHDGQVWRIFTAAWLHASVAHLLGNALVLLLAGVWLERLLGRAWLAAVYGLSAVGGGVASVLMNPMGPVSVGASGAIMGLLGAAFVCSFHVAAHENKGRIRFWTLRTMIPALIPSSGHIDYSAHFGGVLTGAVVGYLLQFIWPEMQARPNRSGVAATIFGAWVLASAVSFGLVALSYGVYVQRNVGLIPDAELPRGKAAMDPRRWSPLAARYPRDPQGALMGALADSAGGDLASGEARLRAALADTETLDNDPSPTTRPALQATLATLLLQDGRTDDAREAAAPVCRMPSTGPALQKMVAGLRARGLCG